MIRKLEAILVDLSYAMADMPGNDHARELLSDAFDTIEEAKELLEARVSAAVAVSNADLLARVAALRGTFTRDDRYANDVIGIAAGLHGEAIGTHWCYFHHDHLARDIAWLKWRLETWVPPLCGSAFDDAVRAMGIAALRAWGIVDLGPCKPWNTESNQ